MAESTETDLLAAIAEALARLDDAKNAIEAVIYLANGRAWQSARDSRDHLRLSQMSLANIRKHNA